MLITSGGAVRAGYDDEVTVRIAHPALPVIGTRVAVAWHDDLNTHLFGALDDGVEVVGLEPEEKAVAVGALVAVADGNVIVFGVEAVKLQDELAVPEKTPVLRVSFVAAQTKQAFIPVAAGVDVCDSDERLRTHVNSFRREQPSLLQL